MGTPFSFDNFDFLDSIDSDDHTDGGRFHLGFDGDLDQASGQPSLCFMLPYPTQPQGQPQEQSFIEHGLDDNAYGHILPGWGFNPDTRIHQEPVAAQQVEAPAVSTSNTRRSRKRLTDASNRWGVEWRVRFLEAVLTIGIGNAKTMDILGFMREKYPNHNVEKKHVESYWQNFRRKRRAQYGLSKNEIPRNEHVPKLDDIPQFLHPLAEYWLRQSRPK